MRPSPRAGHLAIALAVLAIDYALVSPPLRAGYAIRAGAALGAWWILCRGSRSSDEPVAPGWGDARRSLVWMGRFLVRWLLPAILLAGAAAWLLEVWLDRPLLRLPSVIASREEVAGFILRGVIVAPVIEELIYRGLVQPRLRLASGRLASVLLSGLAFWGVHCVDRGELALWNQLAGGWVLAWAYERTRSLVAPTLLHALGNASLLAVDLLRL